MKGFLVCIEGIDGAGKKTQSQLLYNKLKTAGRRASVYSYPDYKSVYGKIIKDYLDKNVSLNTMEFCLIVAANMAKDAKDVSIKIDNGEVVVMDRYFLSTIAYQTAGGLPYESVKKLEDAIALPKPSLIVYLDLDPEESMERKMSQKGSLDRHEGDMKYLNAVKKVYEQMYAENYTGAKWIKINGAMDREEISKRILEAVDLLH